MRYLTRFFALLLSCVAVFLPVNASATGLPEPVASALQMAGVPADDVAVFVQRVDQPQPLLSQHADLPMNPASTMKLLTTYAALDLLGPAYRWKTEIYHDGRLQNGILNGNLILKGYGDPNLMVEDLWRMLGSLRQVGVTDIRGDVWLDSQYFAPTNADAAAFDGEAYRAYNALPNALLVNLKSTSFHFQTGNEPAAKNDAQLIAPQVIVQATPDLPQIRIVNQLKLTQTECLDWRSQFNYQIKPQGDGVTIVFSGNYAVSCGDKYLDLSLFDDVTYSDYLFRQLWQQLGGRFSGHVRQAVLSGNASKLLEQSSLPLADIVRRINKYSNNLMARQLLLTIGAERLGSPATEANGDLAIRRWLLSKNLNFNELVIENGAGLSRNERISAGHLGALLLDAYSSPVMPEFMSSLPILSVDGTVEKRLKNSEIAGRAHLKTGTIDGVFCIAGYVLDQKSRRWVVVFMANHPKAAATRPAQDALLQWVYQQD